MSKSRWAAATGIGSLVLLLAACGGGSSGSTTAAGGGSAPAASSGSAAANSATSSTTTAATATSTQSTSPHVSATPHHTAGPQPSSGANNESIPPVGTTVMIVQHTAIGFVLAEAGGQVLYTYGKDKKGGVPTCTGTCATTWLPATGTPQASPADTFPGQFALIKTASGAEQITYNGYPLYLLKGAKPYATTGNNMESLWHVIPLSASDITA